MGFIERSFFFCDSTPRVFVQCGIDLSLLWCALPFECAVCYALGLHLTVSLLEQPDFSDAIIMRTGATVEHVVCLAKFHFT